VEKERADMSRISKLVIDSSEALTELCDLGAKAGTDKSPYNGAGHRHPYTAVYTMLLSSLKGKAVRFAEIGVAAGSSAEMWTRYFSDPAAQIWAFDRDQNFLDALGRRVPDGRLRRGLMDVGVDGDVERALKEGGIGPGELDALLDDSSHEHGHQLRIVREGFPFVRSGGLLIVEDIFRSTDESEYVEPLKDVLAQCSAAYFVECEHRLKWSPGWNNDKMLVLVKA
jgi:predicted O-methyltransferase YrrM